MKHRVSTLLLLHLPLVLACHGAAALDGPPSELASDPDGCRSFASLGGVSVGETPGEQRCRFDPDTAEQRCEIDVGAERTTSVSEYASLADFVEAGHSIGKVTSLAETRIENGRARRVSHRYDELGRLVRSLEDGRGTTTLTTYGDYDDRGRPRWASAETSGQREACVRLVDIEYSDAARTVRRRSRAADPARCGFAESTLVESYDAAGNRVAVEQADGGGVASLWSVRQPTATQRVCL